MKESLKRNTEITPGPKGATPTGENGVLRRTTARVRRVLPLGKGTKRETSAGQLKDGGNQSQAGKAETIGDHRPAESREQQFDLGRYDPYSTFVPELAHALTAERPVEGVAAAQSVNPIATVTEKLAALPLEALAPAIDATIDQFIPGTTEPQSASEEAVYGYLQRVATGFSRELTDDELDLRARYEESRANRAYFRAFQVLQDRVARGGKVVGAVDARWDTLQEEGSQMDAPDDRRVAELWRSIQTTLDSERIVEEEALQTGSHLARIQYPGLFPGHGVITDNNIDARHHGDQQLAVQGEGYSWVLEAHQEQRDAMIAKLTQEVDELRSVPPGVSARVLWEDVLPEDKKEEIRAARQAYWIGRELVEEASGFTSYKDPSYREFIDTHSEFKAHWKKQIVKVQEGLPEMREVLIDQRGIPHQTIDALEDTNHPVIILGDPRNTIYDAEQEGLLTGYAVDVATVFLMADDFAPQKAA